MDDDVNIEQFDDNAHTVFSPLFNIEEVETKHYQLTSSEQEPNPPQKTTVLLLIPSRS